ncbi:MAG: carbon-nitrogen hydrolase family protein [Promethearchaeota archaeon]
MIGTEHAREGESELAGDLLKVGACSMAAVPGDTEGNLEKIKSWCEEAAKEGVELLLFPELSLSGYWTSSELHYEAQPIDGPATSELVHFLGDLDSDLVVSVGLAEQYGGCIYNTQVLLGRDGEVGHYRKTHWPGAEFRTWGCGDRYPVHEVGGFRVGTAICFDNCFPEVHRIYGLLGTDLILSPYAYGDKFDPGVPESEAKVIAKWKDRERTQLRAAAYSNYQWIVACVGGGNVKDYHAEAGDPEAHEYHFPGVILFIGPDGKVILESPDDSVGERMLSYTLSRLANVEQRRGGNNFFKNRRPITYGRLTELP